MSLSDVERRILLNQYKILSALFPAEAEQYDRMAQMLSEGYHDRWADVVSGDMKEPLPKAETDFVFDVLVMYDWLQKSFFTLSKPERLEFDEKQLRFPGFDAGAEKRLGVYAKFLLQRMEQFTFLNAAPGMVCSVSMRAIYARMLAALPRVEDRCLSVQEIRRVLNAATKRPAPAAKVNRAITPPGALLSAAPMTAAPASAAPHMSAAPPHMSAAPMPAAPMPAAPMYAASTSAYGAPLNGGPGRGAAGGARGPLALKPSAPPAMPREVFAPTPELAAFEAALNASLAREAYPYLRE
jgi:uncharacterized protein YfbU (UPF0304 family)